MFETYLIHTREEAITYISPVSQQLPHSLLLWLSYSHLKSQKHPGFRGSPLTHPSFFYYRYRILSVHQQWIILVLRVRDKITHSDKAKQKSWLRANLQTYLIYHVFSFLSLKISNMHKFRVCSERQHTNHPIYQH